MAIDMHAELLGWVMDEIHLQAMGQEYGAAVTLGVGQAQGPQGVITVPVWQLLLTGRNPVLGEGPLWHMVPLTGPRPDAAQVRERVGDGLRQLRDLAASKLAQGNGHAPLARGRR
jgi:hypothetical protein